MDTCDIALYYRYPSRYHLILDSPHVGHPDSSRFEPKTQSPNGQWSFAPHPNSASSFGIMQIHVSQPIER